MPAITLPMTFANSFWSQDYRRGLETLYGKLDEGLTENVEIFNFIKARALAENGLGLALINAESIVPQDSGFGVDDGATLLATFRSLQAESRKQGEGHKTAAQELVTLVADPFGTWASKHAARIDGSKKDLLEGWIRAYEQATADVDKLKLAYLNKTRRADEIEDNVKFAPGRDIGDSYTLSPGLAPTNRRSAPFARTASVSERIAQRFKELRKGIELQDEERKGFLPASPVLSDKIESEPEGEKLDVTPTIPAKDKGKGKEIVSSPQQVASPMSISPPKLSPPLPELEHPIPNISIRTDTGPPIVIGGLAFPPQALSQLLKRASAELPLRKVRFPILGEYSDCFSGEEFVVWLKDNVQGYGGKLDAAEEAAIELTEREDALRRIGELGNRFSNARDAYFQFRTKAFEFHLQDDNSDTGDLISPVADNLVKRTNTLVSMVQKAVAGGNGEPPHVRARNEAFDAEKIYRVGVRRLDRQRLALEEKIEDTLKMLQRWEVERLRMVKTVLLQYQGIIANLPGALHSSFERSTIAVASFQPETDIIALIERYRTGPFRPCPPLYESITHDQQDTVFGVDLRRWAHENGLNVSRNFEDQKDIEKQDLVPNVVKGLLQGLAEAYNKLPNDSECRKVWIYDVPLPALHHLRESINTLPPPGIIPMDLLAKYDAPILAGTLKLWLLELNPPLCTWDSWDDVKKIYPQVGSAGKDEEERLHELRGALLKLPKVHLVVLDTIIEHLRTLIDTTESEESLEIYVTKLGLSLGRCMLRSKVETQKSLEERHPTLFLMELINRYNELLPKVLAAKKRDSGPLLTRKRTKMVDQRVSRSKISAGIDPQQLLAAQHAAQHGPLSRASSPGPGHPNFPSEILSPQEPELPSKPSDQAKPETSPAPHPSSTEPEPEPEKVVEQAESLKSTDELVENLDNMTKTAEAADTASVPLPLVAEPAIPSPPPLVETPSPPPPPVEPEVVAKPLQLEVPPPPPLVIPAAPAAYQLPPRPVFAEEIEKPTKQLEKPAPEPVDVSGSMESSPARQSPDSTGSVESTESKTRGELDRFGSSRTSLRRTGSVTGVTERLRGARPSSLLARNATGAASASAAPSAHAKTSSMSSGSTSKSPVRRTVNMFNRTATQTSSEQGREYAPRKHVGKASAALFSRRTVASDAEDNILDK